MKHVRDTSAVAYREIEPTLSRRERSVLDALRNWIGEAPTSYELTEYLKGIGQAFDLNSIRPRLTSLQDKHLVETGEKRKCRISGRTVYTWHVSSPRVPLPEPIPQRLGF